MRTGPSIVRVMTSSRSERTSLTVRLLLLFASGIGFLLLHELDDEVVQLIEALVPQPAVALEPGIHLAPRFAAQLVDPVLGVGLDIDEAGLLQHAEVLRDLRLVEPELRADPVHRQRATAQQLDDAIAILLGERDEHFEHGLNMPLQAYSCQGICARRLCARCSRHDVSLARTDPRVARTPCESR